MAEIKTFPVVKVKVSDLESNGYNPKKSYAEDKDNFELFEKVKRSIKNNGYMGWIIVREQDWKYIIVDWFHRTSAMKELWRWNKEVEVTNLWEISEEEAIAKTIVIEETGIPIDKVAEANLWKDLRDNNLLSQAVVESSPYEIEEVEATIQIVEFDFDWLVTPKADAEDEEKRMFLQIEVAGEEQAEELKEAVGKMWYFVTELVQKK